MSQARAAYLVLERAMLALDQLGHPLADRIRDLMDPLWYALSETERAQLRAPDLPTKPPDGAPG